MGVRDSGDGDLPGPNAKTYSQPRGLAPESHAASPQRPEAGGADLRVLHPDTCPAGSKCQRESLELETFQEARPGGAPPTAQVRKKSPRGGHTA